MNEAKKSAMTFKQTTKEANNNNKTQTDNKAGANDSERARQQGNVSAPRVEKH